MKIEVTTNEIINKIEVHRNIGGVVQYEISTEEQAKISKWLGEIRGNGEGIDTMKFPILRYEYYASGTVGYNFIVRELITGKVLDLTNIDLF